MTYLIWIVLITVILGILVTLSVVLSKERNDHVKYPDCSEVELILPDHQFLHDINIKRIDNDTFEMKAIIKNYTNPNNTDIEE